MDIGVNTDFRNIRQTMPKLTLYSFCSGNTIPFASNGNQKAQCLEFAAHFAAKNPDLAADQHRTAIDFSIT
jgi:hypothetical protein